MALRLTATLLLAIAVLQPACAADAAPEPSTERLKVVLLPSRVTVYPTALKMQPSTEWTTAANAALDATLRDQLSASTRFEVVETPTIAPEQQTAIDDFLGLANLVQFGVWTASALPRDWQVADTGGSLGPSLAFLAESSGADYALVAVGFQVIPGKGVVATEWLGAAATILFPPLVMVPSAGRAYTTLLLVDLRTGHLRWTASRSGYEVLGHNFTDVRDPASAREIIADLLKSTPDMSALRSVPAELTDTTDSLSDPPVSPTVAKFEFRPPAGWRVISNRQYSVTVARFAGQLDTIMVERRLHSAAFPKTRQTSSRDAPPDELAQRYVAELQAQDLSELQIVETSTDQQLAGHPAFRVRFTWALPVPWGVVRFEQVTIGAAVPQGLLLANLNAPQLHFFAEALPHFEASMKTLSFKRHHGFSSAPR